MPIELPCLVEKVLFQKEDGFSIIAVNLNALSSKYKESLEDDVKTHCEISKYGNFAVTVSSFPIMDQKKLNMQYVFIGEYVNNPKYGKQFKADYWYYDVPNNEDGLRIFLQSLPNIKEARSKAIIDKFGVEGTIDVLDNEPHRLIEINGITEKRIPAIIKKWQECKCERELYDFLVKHNLSPKLAKKIYKKFGTKSIEVINKTPYRLCEVDGMGFLEADEIAHKVLENISKEQRIAACALYVLQDDLRHNGNLCMIWKTLKGTILEVLKKSNIKMGFDSDVSDYIKLLGDTIKANKDTFIAFKDLTNNEFYIYLYDSWVKESYVAKQIYNRTISTSELDKCTDEDIIQAERDICSFADKQIRLDECQIRAIKTVFDNKVSVITGGGGSGKSSICRCIYNLAVQRGLSVRMMSPTGKASLILSEKTGGEASTIHRSLHLKPGDHEAKIKMKEDIVIIDESSMLGIDTIYPIMESFTDNLYGHLVFVGDCNQLPSVSPGNFLNDIMKSGLINVVKLDIIHRQDEKSFIPLIANDIAKGKITKIPEDAKDIVWFDITRNDNAQEKIECILNEYLADDYDIDELQFLSPKYKDEFGVNNINKIIQNKMCEINNSKDKHIIREGRTFYLYDRVIQTENNYDKAVFNGDIGKIVELGKKVIDQTESDQEEQFIVVEYNGNKVTYIEDEIGEISIAYCITVHKFQGSQAPYIVVIMSDEAEIMMTKELVYTAITRAEKKVTIYGSKKMWNLAPMKSSVRERYTNLSKILQSFSSNRKMFDVYGEKH